MVELMIIGRLETRNYEWTTLAETTEQALDNLRNAWESHAFGLGAVGALYTWEDLEDSVTLEPINLGDTLTSCAVCENLAHQKER